MLQNQGIERLSLNLILQDSPNLAQLGLKDCKTKIFEQICRSICILVQKCVQKNTGYIEYIYPVFFCSYMFCYVILSVLSFPRCSTILYAAIFGLVKNGFFLCLVISTVRITLCLFCTFCVTFCKLSSDNNIHLSFLSKDGTTSGVEFAQTYKGGKTIIVF